MKRSGPSRKPDSALSRHPSPGGTRASLWEAAPTSRAPGARTIWLARTGGLPGRSLAGYRRWALTPPFHPSPVSGEVPDPSAGLLSVALDVAEGLSPSVPRVVSPSGLYCESGLCSTPGQKPLAQRRVGRPGPGGLYLRCRPRPGRPRASRFPAPQEDYSGRRQAKLHPICALPALLPARVVADLGIEPHAWACRL